MVLPLRRVGQPRIPWRGATKSLGALTWALEGRGLRGRRTKLPPLSKGTLGVQSCLHLCPWILVHRLLEELPTNPGRLPGELRMTVAWATGRAAIDCRTAPNITVATWKKGMRTSQGANGVLGIGRPILSPKMGAYAKDTVGLITHPGVKLGSLLRVRTK